MTHTPSTQEKSLSRLRGLTVAAGILVFLLIASGGVVSAAGGGNACPDWPTCLGQWTPPPVPGAMMEVVHRAATFLAAALIAGALFMAWSRFRQERWFTAPLAAAALLTAVQVGLGAWVTLLPGGAARPWLNAAHLGLALLTLSATLTAATAVFYQQAGKALPRPRWGSPFGRLALLTIGASFVMLLSGALVKASGASAACPAWPLCTTGLVPTRPAEWVNAGHRLVVFFDALLVAALFLQAWRTQRTQTPVLVASTAAAVLFFSQALLGARLVQGLPAYLIWLHQATAVAFWGALSIQIVAVGMAQRTAEDEAAEALAIHGRQGLARDLLMLTKPIVVLLLLVTTYAGMVIGAQALPPLSLTFWTLLGGFLAAGGSGAINQYIDRKDDLKMQRTQKRPIPSGRLTPGEGLAFGVGIALASVYLMTAFVNFLAAMLSLAGIIYYVLLYSVFLKKTTVQNIVIGGGAGAIPPLVGWAAATGSLNVPSLFLFAIVFMWTPPHFWALALVRRKDYARAGVPMLPVIRGEAETQRQIFIYTLELVGLTLVLPLFGLGGAIYLIGAAALGGWLLLAAWKVWKEGGNKLAWKMYRYSSMYLAFLFFVLMIDRLM